MTTITVTGTIAPWLWNGSQFYQGQLIDPGIFGPAGTSLTGDAIQIVWNDTPSVSAAITIDGTTVTLGPLTGWYAQYATMTPDYQNITVANFNPTNNLPGNIAVNSFSLAPGTYQPPLGLGGSLELIGPSANCNSGSFQEFGSYIDTSCNTVLDGYFYVNHPVPGPIVGEGLIPLLFFVGWLLAHVPECRKGFQWSTSANRCVKTTEKPSLSSHCGWAGRSPGWCVP